MDSLEQRAIQAAKAALASPEAGAMPDGMAAQIQAGIRMIKESEDKTLSPADKKTTLGQAVRQFETPLVFLPTDVSRHLESARMLADRARRAL